MDDIADPTTGKVVVAGAGPVGLVAALMFSKAGFDTELVGPQPNTGDGRTTALMQPALEMLAEVGVLDAIETKAAPLRTMRIVDATDRLVRSPTVTFQAAELGLPAFGLNIANTHLLETLTKAVEASPIIWRRQTVANWRTDLAAAVATLDDGSQIEAVLVVAADGRLSPARSSVGIGVRAKPTGQIALVVNFSHSRGHGDISTEFHTRSGPFTQVPLPGRTKSSLVWVVTPAMADELQTLDNEALATRVEEQMQSMLGKVTIDTPAQFFPLSSSLPDRFGRDRVALVGESAHVFPPIGAQGMNLGLRDVKDLLTAALKHRSDPGSAKALRAYELRRRPDITLRSGAVNMLNHSLLSDSLIAQVTRSAGLHFLAAFPPARAFLMQEGLKPGSGFASLFRSARKRSDRDRTTFDQV